MFYSTEILSNKSSALSTVWRAGNTAPGALNTGIRRKAVLEVDIEQACGTIIEPPGAPIALRLQGTLLYGTARIYQEKCRYVLTNSERIQRAMVKLCSSYLDSKIDKNAGRAKSVQIALPDDPGFDLDFLQLPPFDFNVAEGISLVSQSRQDSWTNMSVLSRQSNNSLLPQIVLDADSSGPNSYAGGFQYPASGASNMQDSPTPFARQLDAPEEEDTLLADVGLFIDDNGNIVEEELRSEPQLPAFPPSIIDAGSNVAAKARRQKEKAHGSDAAADEEAMAKAVDGFMVMDDDGHIVPPAQLPIDGPAAAATAPKAVWSPQTSSSSSTVLSKKAHARIQRVPNFVDEITQIPHEEYYSCVRNYADNMQRAADRRDHARAIRRANDVANNRKTAYNYTLGRGLFNIAGDLNRSCPDHPLAQMFSGEALEQALYGDALHQAKRRIVAADGPSTPVRRGVGAGFAVPGSEDQDIELGRQPASALSDNPSLQLNRHSSLVPGSSVHGSAQHSAGLGRPLPSSGQRSAERARDPSFIERYSDDGLDLSVRLHSNSVDGFLPPGSSPPRPDVLASSAAIGEEKQSTSDFFGLVQMKAAAEGVVRPGRSTHRWVVFDDIVAPFKRSRPAVVGAFMSLLSLASFRQLRIHQDRENDERIDRSIFVGIKVPEKQKPRKRSFQEMSDDGVASQEDLLSGHVFPSAVEAEDLDYRDGSDTQDAEAGAAEAA